MTDSINRETFEHLVGLAALQLDAAEADYLLNQMNHQLKAIQELAAIPLDEDVPVSLHGVPFPIEISPAPRQDIWAPFANPAEILAQAPQTEDGYIVVPDIPHTTLK